MNALVRSLCVVVALFACIYTTAAYEDVTIDQFLAKYNQPNVLVLDVREPDEFKESHVTTGVNLPLSVIESQLENVPSKDDLEIYVHCRSGVRSAKASVILDKYGIKNIFNVLGGFMAWKGPVASTPTPAYFNVGADVLLPIYSSDSVQVIDIRTPAEFAAGHIPGSINASADTTSKAEYFKITPWVKRVFVISDTPMRTLSIVKTIDSAGFTRIYNVYDGISAWKGPLSTGTTSTLLPGPISLNGPNVGPQASSISGLRSGPMHKLSNAIHGC